MLVFLWFSQQLVYVYGDILNTVWSAEKVFKLLDRKPNMREAGEWIPEKLEGRITFDNVTLSYPSRPEWKALKVSIFWNLERYVGEKIGQNCQSNRSDLTY